MPEKATNSTLVALIVACANFMGALDSTIITMALPQMAHGFAMRPVDLSIGITIYILVTAVFLPVSTWMADRFGARSVFAAAILGFAAASLLCGLSQHLWQFVGARALQALAAALMSPVGNLVLFRSTEKRHLVMAVAISTTPALVAPVIGPPIGGFLISALSWPWIFFLNVPIGVIGALLVLRFIPNVKAAARGPFDVVGFAATGASVGCVIYGLDRVSAADADHRVAALLIVSGLVLGSVAIRHSLRHPHPLISLKALHIRTFTVCSATGGALIKIPLFAMGFVLPLMFQVGMGMSAFITGLLLLGWNGGDLALKAMAGKVLRRYGFRTSLIASAILTAVSTAACMVFGSYSPLWLVFSILVLNGACRSVLFTGVLSLNFADVPQEELGGATVLNSVLSQIVGAVAIAMSAIALNVSTVLRGGDGKLSVGDCRVALAMLTFVGLAAVISFMRLPKNAGVEVSGHQAGFIRRAAPAVD